jgi:hypothetical protein
MAFTYDDLLDLQEFTRTHYPEEGKWVDLTDDVQEYLVPKRLLKKAKRVVSTGKSISWPVQVAAGENGGAMAPYEEVEYTQNNQGDTCQIRWAGLRTSCMWSLIEMAENSGSPQIVDLIRFREHGMKVEFWQMLEEYFWTAAASDDGRTPYSVFYGVREYPAAANTEGFYGSYPFSGTTYAGVANDRLKNWTATYTAVTAADLLEKMRKAAFKCRFSAVPDANLIANGDQRFEVFVNYDTSAEMLSMAEGRNDNLSFDLNKMNGRVTFGGAPITPVPYADEIANWGTYDWVIMLDWSTVQAVFLKGHEEYDEMFKPTKDQPETVVQHKHSVFNIRNLSPRRSAFLTKRTG